MVIIAREKTLFRTRKKYMTSHNRGLENERTEAREREPERERESYVMLDTS